LRYELNNRPKWTAIPLRGLLQLASKKTAATVVTA
jgi:predicted trehalose synthase